MAIDYHGNDCQMEKWERRRRNKVRYTILIYIYGNAAVWLVAGAAAILSTRARTIVFANAGPISGIGGLVGLIWACIATIRLGRAAQLVDTASVESTSRGMPLSCTPTEPSGRRSASQPSAGESYVVSDRLRSVFSPGSVLLIAAVVSGGIVMFRGGSCEDAGEVASAILTRGRSSREEERQRQQAVTDAMRVRGDQVFASRPTTGPSKALASLSPDELVRAQVVFGKFQGSLFAGPLTTDGWMWAGIIDGGDEYSKLAREAVTEMVSAYLGNPTSQGATELETDLNRVVAKLKADGRLR